MKKQEQQPDQQDDANGDGGGRPSSPFPDRLQNRNYGRRFGHPNSAVGAASASSSAMMAFPTRRRVHAAGAGAAASPATAGGSSSSSSGDARAIIESSDHKEDLCADKTSDSVDTNVQDVCASSSSSSSSSSHEEGSRRSSLEIAMEAAAAPKILLQAEQQGQQQQEYDPQDRRRPSSHYNNDVPHTSHDYLVPLKGAGAIMVPSLLLLRMAWTKPILHRRLAARPRGPSRCTSSLVVPCGCHHPTAEPAATDQPPLNGPTPSLASVPASVASAATSRIALGT